MNNIASLYIDFFAVLQCVGEFFLLNLQKSVYLVSRGTSSRTVQKALPNVCSLNHIAAFLNIFISVIAFVFDKSTIYTTLSPDA